MHEAGLVADALNHAIATAEGAGAVRIERLTFSLSPNGHVKHEVIQTLFDAMSHDTIASGAQLAFEIQRIQRYCFPCGTLYEDDGENGGRCPMCNSVGIPETDGPDLVLLSIDINE